MNNCNMGDLENWDPAVEDFGSTVQELAGTQLEMAVAALHSPAQMAMAAAELHKMDMVAAEGKAGMGCCSGGS